MTDQEFDELWARILEVGRTAPVPVATVLTWLGYPDLAGVELEHHITEVARELAQGDLKCKRTGCEVEGRARPRRVLNKHSTATSGEAPSC